MKRVDFERHQYLLELQEDGNEDERLMAEAELHLCYAANAERMLNANFDSGMENCVASSLIGIDLMVKADDEGHIEPEPDVGFEESPDGSPLGGRQEAGSSEANIQSIAVEFNLGENQLLKITIEIAA